MSSPGAIEGGSVRVRLYGLLGERIGREGELDAPPSGLTVAAVRALLAQRHPHAAADLSAAAARACLGDRIVGEDHRVAAGETVEFFPPLSGG
jgi:molybdopterin converting factor small subunit